MEVNAKIPKENKLQVLNAEIKGTHPKLFLLISSTIEKERKIKTVDFVGSRGTIGMEYSH